MNVLIFSFLRTSFGVDLPCGILCNLLSSHTCDRVAGLS